MSWLNRLFRRGDDHQKWLEAHPGKKPMTMAAPASSDEEQQRMRETMEGELQAQRPKPDDA